MFKLGQKVIYLHLPKGGCGYVFPVSAKVVEINRHDWIANKCFGNHSDNHLLMFHELGHCLLERYHDDAENADGDGLSIMHTDVFWTTADYEENFDLYMDELFEGKKHNGRFASRFDDPKPPKQIPEEFQETWGGDLETCQEIKGEPKKKKK